MYGAEASRAQELPCERAFCGASVEPLLRKSGERLCTRMRCHCAPHDEEALLLQAGARRRRALAHVVVDDLQALQVRAELGHYLRIRAGLDLRDELCERQYYLAAQTEEARPPLARRFPQSDRGRS